MKNISYFLRTSFLLSILIGVSTLNASEEDHGLVIVDRKPWKVSWVQESRYWILISNFEKGELKTYFSTVPPSKGLGVNAENKPIKQEFKYYPSGKTYTSKKNQFEQWPDGAKAWAFTYDEAIRVKDDKFSRFCTTAIIQEIGDASNEIRYSFVKGL